VGETLTVLFYYFLSKSLHGNVLHSIFVLSITTKAITMKNSTTTSIMTLTSEIYAANCKQDAEFNTLSADSIAACIRVDLQDKLNRELTESEEDMVDEALAFFGI
jgi:hypothetical protein